MAGPPGAIDDPQRPALRPGPWLLALLLLVGFAVLTGAGAPGVPAPRWSLAAIALAALIGALPWGGRALPVLATGLVGLAGSAVLFEPRFPVAHDLPLHVWALESFARAVAAGDPMPRWHPSLGLGQPLGVFYPPIPFWAGVPFHLLGLAPAPQAKGALVLWHAQAGASMAAAVLHAGRDRFAALGSGVAYALAPYLLFDLHGRGALGESAAFVFLPWLLAGVDRALRGERAAASLLAGGIGVVNAHALALLILGGALPIAAAATVAVTRTPRAPLVHGLGRAALLGGIAVLTAGHWLAPAILESRQVSIARVANIGGDYADFAPPPASLLERRANDHMAGALARSVRQPGMSEMPYYVGLGVLVLAAAGARGARRRPGDLFALALLVVTLALCVEPLAGLWGRVEWLARIQYPWRHLLPATVAAAWLAGPGLAALRAAPHVGATVAAAAVALLIVDAHPYLGLAAARDVEEQIAFDDAAPDPAPGLHAPLRWGTHPLRCEDLPQPPADRRLVVWRSRPAYNEYFRYDLLLEYVVAGAGEGSEAVARRAGVRCLARDAAIRVQTAAPLARVVGADGQGRALVVRVEERGDTQQWQFDEPVHGRLELLQMFFPGFTARDDAGRPASVRSCDGWICVELAEPTSAVILHFGATPVRAAGIAVSGLGVLLAAGLVWRERQRRAS